VAWPRIVVHADMDAFYASVEQLDDPSLRGRPILVGPESGRGVVLTASYEARPFGVGSAMPMSRAKRMCPQALIVPPRFKRYTEISRIVMGVFEDFSPDVEAISLDEAFLEMTGTTRTYRTPGEMGRALKAAVKEATGGLTASVGISGTKYVAKVASDFRKPDGLTVVQPDHARTFLSKLPVRRLWGVGPKTEERLAAVGYTHIGQIADEDEDILERKLGRLGLHLQRLGRGNDPRRIQTRRRARSIGSERTLAEDVSDRATLEEHLRTSAESIGKRLRSKSLLAGGVRVKLKTSSFQGLSRQTLLPTPTDVGARMYEAAMPLLDQFPTDEPFRLVGMAAYDIIRPDDPVQLKLFDGLADKAKLERAMDAVRSAFGDDAVVRAERLGGEAWVGPNLDFVDSPEEEEAHWEAEDDWGA
jgi:DNA polymerase IV